MNQITSIAKPFNLISLEICEKELKQFLSETLKANDGVVNKSNVLKVIDLLEQVDDLLIILRCDNITKAEVR